MCLQHHLVRLARTKRLCSGEPKCPLVHLSHCTRYEKNQWNNLNLLSRDVARYMLSSLRHGYGQQRAQ